MIDARTLVTTLLEYSKAQGLTDSELASRTGIARSSISMMRHGEQDTTIASFLAICDALDVEPEHAIQGHPEGIPPQTITVGGRTYRLEEDGE
ncbi:helix-turn-helix domain-containing protein [Corynebacterium ureicelerivorans]